MSDLVPASRNDKIVFEAHKRFERTSRWESNARANMLEDYKFAHADSYNNYQWPGELYNSREGAAKPALTINKVRVHNNLIINDAKQNKASISIRPVGDGATRDSADIFEGVIRHIEHVSKASVAYDTAIEWQVDAGLGYIRVVTDYIDDKSFDQEILIKRVADPFSVYLDPDHKEKDGSDARFAFVFSDEPREEVERLYPQFKGRMSPANSVDGDTSNTWITDDHIRVCEYYKKEEEKDTLFLLPDGTTVLRSQINRQIARGLQAEIGEDLRKREVVTNKVKWFKIVGDEIVDEADWAGDSIPIVPVIGEETVIEGELDRKGHTRAMIDAQRIYNYNRSADVEFGALQSKTPYISPAAAIEGLETYWNTANVVNHAVLPYKHVDNDGQTIPAPQRQEPPTSAVTFTQGAQIADNDMMLASGQYQAQMGAPSNEQSGKAINERQRQGDRATYHFIDNQAIAIRRVGDILLDLIPKIYDTPRVIRILAEDGEEQHIEIDPSQPQALQSGPVNARAQQVAHIFNPGVGKYEVEADVGPSYATARQQAFDAIVQVLTQAPNLIPVVGDLLFKAADFPLSEEIQERLHNMVPPEALGQVNPQVQHLQAQIAQLNKLNGETLQALSEERLKNAAKAADATIDAYRADTDRMAVAKDMMKDLGMIADPNQLRQFILDTIKQADQDNLGPAVDASEFNLQGMKDMAQPGAPNAPGAPVMPGGQLPVQQTQPGNAMVRPGGM